MYFAPNPTPRNVAFSGLKKKMKSSLSFGIVLKCGLSEALPSAQKASEQEKLLPMPAGKSATRKVEMPGMGGMPRKIRIPGKRLQSISYCLDTLLVSYLI